MERSADWMDQAQGDLAHARNDLDDGFYDWGCFSAQQAAEKAAKAAIQAQAAVPITARYPDAHPSGSPRGRYTRIEAQRLVKHAEQIIEFCARRLPAP